MTTWMLLTIVRRGRWQWNRVRNPVQASPACTNPTLFLVSAAACPMWLKPARRQEPGVWREIAGAPDSAYVASGFSQMKTWPSDIIS